MKAGLISKIYHYTALGPQQPGPYEQYSNTRHSKSLVRTPEPVMCLHSSYWSIMANGTGAGIRNRHCSSWWESRGETSYPRR